MGAHAGWSPPVFILHRFRMPTSLPARPRRHCAARGAASYSRAPASSPKGCRPQSFPGFREVSTPMSLPQRRSVSERRCSPPSQAMDSGWLRTRGPWPGALTREASGLSAAAPIRTWCCSISPRNPSGVRMRKPPLPPGIHRTRTRITVRCARGRTWSGLRLGFPQRTTRAWEGGTELLGEHHRAPRGGCKQNHCGRSEAARPVVASICGRFPLT